MRRSWRSDHPFQCAGRGPRAAGAPGPVTWTRRGNARTVPDGERIRLGGPVRLRDGLEAFRPHPWAAAVVLRDHLGDGP
jgi:hypothetical protein